MKKVFYTLVLFGFFNYAHAQCYCTSSIMDAFESITQKVDDYINAQTDSVGQLIKQIKKNTDDINEQNEVIKKIIEGEKHKALQNTHIAFLLRKIVELKTAGEM